MIEQLKEKLRKTKRRMSKFTKSWSVKKVQLEFGVPGYLARQLRKLVEERGILSLPDPSRRPVLPSETVVHSMNLMTSVA